MPVWVRRYERAWLRGDVVAGISVAAYLIPQVMAYATVVGLPPVVGLRTAIAPLLLYALLGSSRQLSVGPEASTAVMTAAVLGPIAVGADPKHYAALAATLALLVGVVTLAARLIKLGFLSELLSRPVLVGYMAGIAIVMIVGQLDTLTSVPVHGETVATRLRTFVIGLPHLQPLTLLLAASVWVLLELLTRLWPRSPAPLLGMLAATWIVAALSLQRHGIHVVGTIPAGAAAWGWPALSVDTLSRLAVPAVGIAIVGFSDNVLTARAFAGRHTEDVDANKELGALGVCNIATGLMHGFPVSSSSSRTAIADAVGGRTQLYSLITLATLLITLMSARGILAEFPTAALGGVVVFAATRLINRAEFRRIAHFRRSELILALATTVAVVAFGVLYGVLAAIGISILDLLRRMARPHDGVLGFVPGMAGMHDVDDYPEAVREPGLHVYRYDAPLCFANADDFLRRALASLRLAPERVDWFLLNAEANVEVDLTALDALDRLRIELESRGIVFAMARVKQDLREPMTAAGLIPKIGEDRLFLTLPTAVEAYRYWRDNQSNPPNNR